MLLVNATAIHWQPEPAVVPGTAVYFESGKIVAVGPSADLLARYPEAQRLDAAGLWLLPGMVCAHTHLYSAFARGLVLPGEPPADFPGILRRLWWRLDRALGYDDIRYSALVVLVDCIRHGVTTLFDHHSSPTAARFSLDVLAEAVLEAGVNACLCYEISDRDGPASASDGLAENVRFLESRHVRTPQLRAQIGLHASMTLSHATVKRAVEAERSFGVGFHVHVAESQADVSTTLREHGVRVVERWYREGVLGPRTVAAHCVHVDDEEIALLKDTRTRVVHNARSNMNNGVGTAPVVRMLQRGLPVGLGNDGFNQNLFQELQAAFLLPKLADGDPRSGSVSQYADLLLRHNPRTAEAAFGLPSGRIEVGAPADLILVRYDPPTPVTAANLAGHMLFGLPSSQVDTTIAAGRLLMRHGELGTLDEAAISAQARELAAELWRRI